jgi:hypothetical protein
LSLIFETETKSIKQLDETQLQKILKKLSVLEASQFGIPLSSISIVENTKAADGGVDGQVEWISPILKFEHPNLNLTQNDYFPSSLIIFQCKATKIPKEKCIAELVEKKTGQVKQSLDDLFLRNGDYILFTTEEINKAGVDLRIDAMRQKLKELGKPYADAAKIHIYDASKIATWCSKYLNATVTVNNWLGKSFISGLKSYEEWSQNRHFLRFQFSTDSKLSGFLEQLRKQFNDQRQVSRIIGLPGLGKTRLAFEVFKPEASSSLYQQVVYLDAAYGVPHIAASVSDFIRQGLRGIIVVDNCDLTLHIQLTNEITRSNSNLSVLTIDYNFDRDASAFIKLEPHADSVIKCMLEPEYKHKILDLDRVVDFAQGFPQMATLLVDARLTDDPNLGNLSNDDLVRRLLWGSGAVDKEEQEFLKSCALFDQFGFKDDVQYEADFIADQMLNISYDKFYEHLIKFKKRGIIRTHGRYAQMIPKPLSIRLASDWWTTKSPERTRKMITSPLPGQLSDALCSQVARLDFLPEVKELTHQLCGCQGPFGQAEEILSERGSRLFCSLVDTNPAACVDALERVLANLNNEDLKNIKGKVRRNIIWSLEKICFHRDSFSKGARLMLLLATAENEKFSNNATGQFLQLFDTYISGTEADPKMRLNVIREALLTSDSNQIKLAVKALEKALPKISSGRWLGSENQGSGKALRDWQPKTWDEVYEYWDTALKMLASLAVELSEIGQFAQNAIANNIRGLMRYHRFKVLNDTINLIIDKHGNYWPGALSEIRASLCYDKKFLSVADIENLKNWDTKLQPNNIRDQLKLFVCESLIELDANDEAKPIQNDPYVENLSKLAEKFVDNPAPFIDNFDVLLVGHQANSYEFGKILGNIAQNLDELINQGLNILKTVPSDERNPLILVSLFNQLRIKNFNASGPILDRIAKDDSLVEYYPRFLQKALLTKTELNILIRLIKENKLSVDSAETFTLNKSLAHLKSFELSDFLSEIADFEPKGAWIALEIISNHRRNQKKLSKGLKDKLVILIKRLKITPKSGSDSDFHYWQEEVKFLLKTENKEIAVLIARQIVEWIEEPNYFAMIHFFGPIIAILFEKYPQSVWPLFSNTIKKMEAKNNFKLVHLLKESNGLDKTIYHVLKLKKEYLLQWCQENTSFAPKFLAQIIPIIQVDKDKGTLHELSLMLINEYGNDQEVLQALEQNIGTFSWIGSLVKIYKIQEEGLESIENHSNANVRLWASNLLNYIRNRNKQETIRDEELEIGLLH